MSVAHAKICSMPELKVGYGRVSTAAQDLTAQEKALRALGVPEDRIYVDHGLTGRNRKRPGLGQAPAACQTGETLVVTKLDRLARSITDVRDIVAELTEHGTVLQIGNSVHDPRDPIGRLLFNMLAVIAEFEADLISMRTREGMRVAMEAGKLTCRKPKLSLTQEAMLVRVYEEGGSSIAELMHASQVGRGTVYRAIDRLVRNLVPFECDGGNTSRMQFGRRREVIEVGCDLVSVVIPSTDDRAVFRNQTICMSVNGDSRTPDRSSGRPKGIEPPAEQWALLVPPRPSRRNPLRRWRKVIAVLVLAIVVIWGAGKLLIEDEGAAGHCIALALWDSCIAVPLKTFSNAAGLALPRDAQVVSSGSSGWGFFGRMSASGVLSLPRGDDNLALGTGTTATGTTFSRSTNKLALQKRREFEQAGGIDVQAFDFNRLYVANGWIVKATFPRGKVELSISLQTTNHWSKTGPLLPDAPTRAATSPSL